MGIIVDSFMYNLIPIIALFFVAYNSIPLFAPVATKGTYKRLGVTIFLVFVVYSSITQGYHPDMILWLPLGALTGLLASYFKFRVRHTK